MYRLFFLLFLLPLVVVAPLTCAAAAGDGQSNCAGCHEKQVKSMADKAMHASVHAKAGIDKCTACHEESALRKSHQGIASPGPVKARRYPKTLCLACHGTETALAAKTAKSKVLTDTSGKVVNPHQLPKGPGHDKADECSNCHKEHKAKVDVQGYCGGCHHTGEYACGTCHPN